MKKILIVEEEQVIQKALGDFLVKEGFEVISALDGEIGQRLAKDKTPDLIILDIMLPKIEGFEVLKELKKDKKTKNIPVLMLTNLERAEDIEKALRLGAISFMVKTNYSLSEVVEKIKKII